MANQNRTLAGKTVPVADIEHLVTRKKARWGRRRGLRAAVGRAAARLSHITHDAGDIAIVEGYAGTGKSTILAAARKAWEAQGDRVWDGTVSGRAAESLEIISDIPSRTLASWERAWSKGTDALTPHDIFAVDQASMLGTNQLEHVAWKVGDAGAKLALVGNGAQLQAIDADAPMRALAARVGQASLTTIRRQH